ncbi:MAG: hypothetical protein AB1609_15340 [Bacillota bacterium]
MRPLEREFEHAMYDIYRRAKKECGYNPTRFVQMLSNYGGLETAKRLLASNETQTGLTELYLRGRLDLSMEALVVKDRFVGLFTREERERAVRRLLDLDPCFFDKNRHDYGWFFGEDARDVDQ